MSHPDPLFDPDNSMEDDMVYNDDEQFYMEREFTGNFGGNYDDHDDFYDDYDDSMDGDHDSAMDSIGWGDDDSLAYGGGDYYGDDF